jgi:hypothetical protein
LRLGKWPNFSADSQFYGKIVSRQLEIINHLNAELNPICQLVVLLGDLTFMGSCIVSIFQYISNKMQRYIVYLYLHVSVGTSTHHQERIQLSTASGICHTVAAICRYRFHLHGSCVLVAVRHTGRPLTHSDYTRCCINTIVLLRMST